MSADKKDSVPQPEAEDVKTEAQEKAEEVKQSPEAEPNSEDSAGKKTAKKDEKMSKASKAEDEMAVLNDKYLRVCAEYDNFRRRSQKEREGLYSDIRADTVIRFLPVYDNLERALAQSTEDEAYRKGVEMIMSQFISTLEKLGVTIIDCLGEKFDPVFHNAVMHVDDEEKGESEIVEVFQKGFKLGDKVIRFAMVKVAN